MTAAPLRTRFEAMLDKDGPIPAHRPELGPCHQWTGKKDRKGYGLIKLDGREKKVGVELNADYAALARQRIGAHDPLFNAVRGA